MKRRHIGACLAAVLVAACSGQELPAKQLADSEATVRAAEERQARNVPRAALHLTLAKEQVEAAQKMIKRKDYERAQSLLTRAQADAELSLALAQNEEAAKKAAIAVDRVEKQQQQQPTPAVEN